VNSVPPHEVMSYAAELAAALGKLDGSPLVAAYLHGSGALGGWIPGRSDVDILFVAADDTTPATTAEMAQVIQAAGAHCPGREVETSVVTAAAARDPAPPWPYLVHVVAGPAGTIRVAQPDAASPGDRDLLIQYAVCRAAGRTVLGPPARELIGPVERAAILDYLAENLAWGLEHAPEPYAVLNACRARVYLSDDDIVSKVAAGEAALRRGTGPPAVIRRALDQQRGYQPDQRPAADAIEFVLATAARLRSGS
jgi:Domain of unknown function (DUF4111)